MTPGEHKGKKVSVPYSLPIIFEVNRKTDDVLFSEIDQVPLFPGCEDLPKDEQKRCLSQKITEHVGRNINTKIAKDSGLTGKQRIHINFKIDKEGNIIDVKSRTEYPALEAEIVRVIKTLPKMIPGVHDSKKVNMLFSLPMTFYLGE